jgi:hypothetical protein
MGSHVTLALHGIANFSRGVSTAETSLVVRLRDLCHSKERLATDLVIIRSREELHYAVNTRLDRVMIISNDCVETLPEIPELPCVISVSSKFDYLSDGNVVGFHPRSKR